MAGELPTVPLSGTPYPLGATCDGRGTNFAVFAGGAEQVDLCLFDATGRQELRRVTLRECTDGVWHGYLPTVAAGQLYGYRAHGPYQPEQGLRYNSNKLLLDPYARRIAGSTKWSRPANSAKTFYFASTRSKSPCRRCGSEPPSCLRRSSMRCAPPSALLRIAARRWVIL